MTRGLLGLLAAVSLAVAAGCGSDGESARALKALAPRVLGPAQKYEVTVSGASNDRIQSARIRATRLATGEGLVMDDAVVDLSDIRFNRERRELLGVGRADFSAVILQEDLTAALKDRTSVLRGLRVRLTPQGAQLRGTADLPSLQLPVLSGVKIPVAPELTLDGKLTVDTEGRLNLEPNKLHVVGLDVPTVAGKLLATQVNPLLDLSGMRLPVIVKTVECGNGDLRITGRAEPRAALSALPAAH